MSKTLITYFSAGGNTKKMAESLSLVAGADLFEIKPTNPYTKKDLIWVNPVARCNKEKFGKREVTVDGWVENWEDYDTVFIGFPIWYGSAPKVVNEFCKGYDWTGKKVAVFATSGGSKIGKTKEKLEEYLTGANLADAEVFRSEEDAQAWMAGILG